MRFSGYEVYFSRSSVRPPDCSSVSPSRSLVSANTLTLKDFHGIFQLSFLWPEDDNILPSLCFFDIYQSDGSLSLLTGSLVSVTPLTVLKRFDDVFYNYLYQLDIDHILLKSRSIDFYLLWSLIIVSLFQQ